MAGKSSSAFSEEEKAAMKDVVAESRRAKKGGGKAADAAVCLERIAGMADEDRALAEKVHEIVTTVAPELDPKTWFGMPAYARDGKVVVFFKDAAKFKSRYATLGFEEKATLDDGAFWPTSYALTAIDSTVEATIADLVRRAVG